MLLNALRRATAAQHASLHRDPLLAPLASGQADAAGVVRALGVFASVYAVQEPRARRGLAALPAAAVDELAAFPQAPVCAWLQADGIRPSGPAVPPLPLDTLEWQVGYAYVRQGSTLGGRVMHRALQQAGVGQHFLGGYGAQTGAQWRRFLDALAGAAPRLDSEAVCAAAVATFASFEQACAARREALALSA